MGKTVKVNYQGDMNNIPQNAANVKDFDALKRAFESAYQDYMDGKGDYTAAAYALATAIANSVKRKCNDPQRKTATRRDNVSNNGFNPGLRNLSVMDDMRLLDRTRRNNDNAYILAFNAKGELEETTIDPAAAAALNKDIDECLSDGMDLVQIAVLSLIELATERAAHGLGWLDAEYTTVKLSKRVYVRLDDEPRYNPAASTPMTETYRAVRRNIEDSKHIRVDLENPYSYDEVITARQDTIYYRMGKYADIGGHVSKGSGGTWTVNRRDYVRRDFDGIVTMLDLTAKQLEIVTMAMDNYSQRAIAAEMGVTQQAVQRTLTRVKAKAEKIGFSTVKWELLVNPEPEQE